MVSHDHTWILLKYCYAELAPMFAGQTRYEGILNFFKDGLALTI